MDNELIPLRSYAFRHEAELAQQMLQAAGIESRVQGDDASGWAPHIGLVTGGVTLWVDKAQGEEARAVLNEAAPGNEPE